ncbi:MAG: Lrp/AsnC family transcriptional regulator [Chloroflexota bacterium]|nr:Lrp/AsnC family transcriptional regulator [Chloroflexota bacterium]
MSRTPHKNKREEIFRILENDARVIPEDIATMTGVPLTEVRKTIQTAEEDGTIVKYKTMVDWDRIGIEQVWSLIEVRVRPEREVGFDRIAERICRFPEARSVYLLSGTYDIAVIAVCKTMQEVSEFASQKLATLDNVEGTVTHFMLKRYKQDGEVLDGTSKSKRLPLTL